MTTLVTGSNGLVGSALKEVMKEDAFFATREHADLTNYSETEKLFSRIRPSKVIHLAAVVGGIGGNLIHSGEYFRENVQINVNTLEAARKFGVQRVVSFMSTCVFPNDAPYPLSPETLHLGQPHPSNFGYAYAKRMLEVQSRAYRTQWNLDYVVAIPANIYGPHDNFNLTEGHVVPALIHKTLLAKNQEKDIIVWGTGQPLREFIYSADVAKLALWMLENYFSENPLILSSGIETSISELTRLVANSLDYRGQTIFDDTKPEGQLRKPSDTTPLNQAYPSFEFMKVEEGIRLTVEWFLNNYPKVRS